LTTRDYLVHKKNYLKKIRKKKFFARCNTHRTNGGYPEKKEKRRRKRDRKRHGHSGGQEENKENGEGNESTEERNSPLIKPEKPTLIKTLNFGRVFIIIHNIPRPEGMRDHS